jgi:hypothetical protein
LDNKNSPPSIKKEDVKEFLTTLLNKRETKDTTPLSLDDIATLLGGWTTLYSEHRNLTYSCICEGNLRDIVHNAMPYIGKKCIYSGKSYTFYGVVITNEDYYYGLSKKGEDMVLLSCVGNLDTWNVTFDSA